MTMARHHVHAHMELADKASDRSERLPNDCVKYTKSTECPDRTCAAPSAGSSTMSGIVTISRHEIEAGVGRGQIDASWALSIPWFTMRFMALPVPRQYDNHHIATGDSFIMHVSRWSLSLVAGGIIYAKSNLDPLSSRSHLISEAYSREPRGSSSDTQRQHGDLCSCH
jgi:hypothetical protein